MIVSFSKRLRVGDEDGKPYPKQAVLASDDAGEASRLANLRLRGEGNAPGQRQEKGGKHGQMSPEELRWVIDELRVYQVELEIQNDELQQAQVELDAAREHYFELYDLAPVGSAP